jgi:hypothetical protein
LEEEWGYKIRDLLCSDIMRTTHEFDDVERCLINSIVLQVYQEKQLLGRNNFGIKIVAFTQFFKGALKHFCQELVFIFAIRAYFSVSSHDIVQSLLVSRLNQLF